MGLQTVGVVPVSGQYNGSFSTASTTYVTALSVTGQGRLNVLYNSTVSITVRVTIDGVIMPIATIGSGGATGYINALGLSGSAGTMYNGAFNHSLQIEILATAGTVTIQWQYEK